MKKTKKNLNPKQLTLFDLDEFESVKKPKEPATELMKMVAVKAPVKRKIERDFSMEEAKEIKQMRKENSKKDPNVTTVEEEEDKAKERRRREKMIKIKKLVKEMEVGNRDKIILFPSYSRSSDTTEWYKLGEISALYYAYRMADRLGRKGKASKDTDRYAKMSYVASVKGIDGLTEQIMGMNEFERYEVSVDGIYIFYLKKPLTDEEVGILRRTEQERKEMMHSVLKPKNADPKVYQAILALDRQILPRTAKMEKGYFRSAGDTLAKATLELFEIYFCYADGMMEAAEFKLEMSLRINRLRAVLAALGENNVIGHDAATAIGGNTAMLKRLIDEVKG